MIHECLLPYRLGGSFPQMVFIGQDILYRRTSTYLADAYCATVPCTELIKVLRIQQKQIRQTPYPHGVYFPAQT